MAHRSHLLSLRFGHAFVAACLTERYNKRRFLKDLLAGVTIGVIAIPLAMALAIASGVPPQYGLYTAMIAGLIIALSGGSRFSVSGPTAAFVVILHPVAHTYGLRGILIASVMAGMVMILMAFLRLGRFIEYIPESVTLGFTGGIAVVIATLQIQDFFGLPRLPLPEDYLGKLWILLSSFDQVHTPSFAVAAATLLTMVVWPKLRTPIPPHLPSMLVGCGIAFVLARENLHVDTIGSRFTFLGSDGAVARGIPPYLPSFQWPWLAPGVEGEDVAISLKLISQLFPTAFAIALLGAIESLLCAVVLDSMSGKRHSANSELLGQGIGNLVAPFFGGITATAAIARSAANFRAGAESPLSAVIHALVVVLGVVLFAPVLAYLPMSSMAALLLVVAWNMSEFPKSLHLIRTAPRPDLLVLLTCFSLTVLLDMVVAITVGVLLAAVLFVNEIARLTQLTETTEDEESAQVQLQPGWRVFKVTGPLFFAAADRVASELALKSAGSVGIVLDLKGVQLLDAGGTAALGKLIEFFRQEGMELILVELQPQPQKTVMRARLSSVEGVLRISPTLKKAFQQSPSAVASS